MDLNLKKMEEVKEKKKMLKNLEINYKKVETEIEMNVNIVVVV